VPPEDGPGGTGGATEPPDERIVSWRERTAEAVNPVEPWEVTPAAIIELVEHTAKAIVDNPDQVRVHGITGECTLVIELRVATADIGKVIGKGGRTITAMRTTLHATRAQKDTRHVLEVLGLVQTSGGASAVGEGTHEGNEKPPGNGGFARRTLC
jgi:predicted RNA-binding protein YlqC (UPF0109 family)